MAGHVNYDPFALMGPRGDWYRDLAERSARQGDAVDLSTPASIIVSSAHSPGARTPATKPVAKVPSKPAPRASTPPAKPAAKPAATSTPAPRKAAPMPVKTTKKPATKPAASAAADRRIAAEVNAQIEDLSRDELAALQKRCKSLGPKLTASAFAAAVAAVKAARPRPTASGLSPEMEARIDAMMGLAPQPTKAERRGSVLYLGTAPDGITTKNRSR